MAETRRNRGSTPVLSLLALAGALFGVISMTHADPPDQVELTLNMTHSTGPAAVTPIP
ncbi:hypothetical protein [Sphaerisporangium corydalis]|uniref:Uncharacterized protein n=1 Tax=Sphaerisporangium corydalis TaxID=1441875 RepID=A0ABV9E673_9ACTN|nr:hypothetical protein [Sphaerisporangium corydalis]